MDLWIRIQDRTELTKVTHLDVRDNDVCVWNFGEDCWTLGSYKSEERALEVLDEIQEHLDYLNIGNINRVDENGFRVCTIYEMPKE